MRKIKTPKMHDEGKREIDVNKHQDFYYNFQHAILRSLLNRGKIKQVQYELCIKELYNQKYDL